MGADVFVELKASISDFQAKMAEARGEMEATAKKGGSSFDGLAAVGKGALMGVAGAAVAVGVLSVDMADKFETSHAKLVTALKAAGHSFTDFKAPIDATDKAMEGLGFTNADTQGALAQMTIALQDPTRAMSMMSLAADIARARNMDLASAALLVEKASEGQLRPLKQAGIDLPILAGGSLKVATAQGQLTKAQEALNAILVKHPDAVNAASKAHDEYVKALGRVAAAQTKLDSENKSGSEIIDALTQRFGGQAKSAAETFGGKIGVLKTQAEDFAVVIGLKLIPIIESLATTTEKIVGWLEKHQTVAKELAAAIAGPLVIAIGAYIVSMVAAAAATIAATLPLYLALVAAAALAAGILYLATHWSQVWADIKKWTSEAVDFVKDHIYLLVPILLSPLAPLIIVGGAIYELATNWDRIFKDITTWTATAWADVKSTTLDIVNAVVAFVMDKTEFLRQWWNDHLQAMSDIASAVWLVIKTVFQDTLKAIETIVRTEIDIIQTIITVAFSVIQTVVSTTMPIVRDLISTVLAVIGATWRNAWNAMRDLLIVLWQVIYTVVDVGIHTVLNVIGIVLDLITGRWGQAWKDLRDTLSAAWNGFIGLLDTFTSKFYDIGLNIVQGLINGVKSVDVGRILGDIWNGLLGAAKKILGISSPSTVFYDIGKNLMLGLAKGVADHMLTPAAAMKSVVGSLGGLLGGVLGGVLGTSGPAFSVGSAPFSPAPAGGNAALGQQMAAVRGWTGAEWVALNNVAMRESGWSNTARNASSGAYGIAQALPASKYPYPGQAAGGSDPATQIAWMLDYIQGRYGDPINAWAHEQSAGWYDRGGIVPPGLSMMLNNTGGNEMAVVIPKGSGQINAGGGVNVTVNVQGSLIGGSPDAIARALLEPIRRAYDVRGRSLPGGAYR